MGVRGIIKYSLIIIVIVAVAFLSQQAYTRTFGKNVMSSVTDQASAYLAKGANWATSNIVPKISGLPTQAGEALQKRGDTITTAVSTAVSQEKQKVSESITKKVENYFSGIANSITKPGTPQNCPTTAPAN